ncbi:MAG: nucleotide sugar dehydrogenase [Candidatus Woesearchaeota archaeon]
MKIVGIFQASKAEQVARLNKRDITVAIVGFGYIGCCIGAVLAEKGCKVIGIDINKKIVEIINKKQSPINEPKVPALLKRAIEKNMLIVTTDFSFVKKADFIIITVGTPIGEDYEPILDHIRAASTEVAKYLEKGHMVIIKSTVPPFTTRNFIKPILEYSFKVGQDFGLAFCPERIAEGRAVQELQSIPIVIGADDTNSMLLASLFWSNILNVKTINVSSTLVAEMTKLADNIWIDLNIALANELALVCDKIGADVLEVIKAANSLPKVMGNVNILLPSMGVGGYCLTKDPWFIFNFAKKNGIHLKTPVTSRNVNEYMPHYTFSLIEQALKSEGKKIEESKVAVLGLSFKNGTGDVRNTPTKITIELLKQRGYKLAVFDPWVNEEDTKIVTGMVQANSIEMAVSEADVIAFLTGHPEFISYPLDKLAGLVKKDCWFIDGRNSFEREKVVAVGFKYKGIGR